MENRKNIKIEVGSLIVFSLAAFTLVALLTYSGVDSSLFSHGVGAPQNACGRVGAYLSSVALNYFGLGGFLLPAGLFFIATTIHKRAERAVILGTLGGMIVAVSSLTVFLALQWKYWSYGGTPLLIGGIFGTWAAHTSKIKHNHRITRRYCHSRNGIFDLVRIFRMSDHKTFAGNKISANIS